MDVTHSDTHALLRELQPDDGSEYYREHAPQASLPYTQPRILPTDVRHTYERFPRKDSVRDRIQHQAPLYESQSTQGSGCTLFNQSDAHLDAYDRALLARTTFPRDNQHIKDGRVMLKQPPGPTRDRNRSNAMIQQQPGSSLAHFMMHTPPNRNNDPSSSPPTCMPSSPSLEVTQRRKAPEGHHMAGRQQAVLPFPRFTHPRAQPKQLSLEFAPPIVQGIRLVAPNDLPDRFRSIFSFPLFNAVQSKCYTTVYGSDENVVVSAPTGSGKTVILELAVCRSLLKCEGGQYKIVYMAPTKSLCSERQRDWQAKFSSLGLNCAELTGDTDHAQLRHVQNASIIITTPEKWDSMTRKWKDHAKLMQLVKLFLIDEVHILKETRGAILEAVVSRMKSVGTDVRFVALSATVPNSEDIAQWLGKDSSNQQLPARQERFGEEFRPVKLQRFVHGISHRGSDFAFEAACDPRLPDIIAKHTHKKPMMVFCFTRRSCISTAKLLANLWATRAPQDRLWPGPTFRMAVQDPDLKGTLTSGVAFHHAGLDLPDRHAIEKGFLEGQIHVICCTSTLAVGVNLPCHLVIIKNTVCFQDDGIKEYADLEIMQMLGRAGRPQYDDNAVAVIITKQEKVQKYEKMISGVEVLESCLHLNLIDHLNAEVGLGTIYDLQSAKTWLGGTFLAIRLSRNPDHYKINGDAPSCSLDDRLQRICQRDLQLLRDHDLLSSTIFDARFKSTEFGDAMARYYVKFDTMKILLSLEQKSKMSELLSALSQAEEFREVRLKGGEKALYKELNKANGIKFPIKVDLALHAHKRSLLLQAELGSVEFPTDEQYSKHKRQYNQDKAFVFSHINRLIRCVIDCQIHLQDAITVRNGLELARSLSARVWDNSPHQMKQLPNVGSVAIRKLVMGGVNSIEALEAAEPHRIELLMSRNPPFGQKLLASTRDFPKLRVSVKMMGKDVKPKQPVKVRIKAECGFLNDRPPTVFHRRPIYVCLLVERSDGLLVDFRRMSATKLANGQDILLSAELTANTQYITAYVMCDEIAGTMRRAELKPELPASIFLQASQNPLERQMQSKHLGDQRDLSIRIGPSHAPISKFSSAQGALEDDEFLDIEVDDQALMEAGAAEATEFNDVDAYIEDTASKRRNSTKLSSCPIRTLPLDRNQATWNPTQLDNGNWACNHKCKDKTACKHLCCREGVEKPPKPPKTTSASTEVPSEGSKIAKQEKGWEARPAEPIKSNPAARKKSSGGQSKDIHVVDMTNVCDDDEYAKVGPRDYKSLHRLHQKVNKPGPARILPQIKPKFSYTQGDQPQFSFLGSTSRMPMDTDHTSSDYGDGWMDDLPSTSVLLGQKTHVQKGPNSTSTQCPVNASAERLPESTGALGEEADSPFEEDVSDLEATLIGLDDSRTMASHRIETSKTSAAGCQPGNNDCSLGQNDDEKRSCSPDLFSSAALDQAGPATASRREERLFLSTDSPEKTPTALKRRHAMLDEDLSSPGPVDEPAEKRRKASGTGEDAIELAGVANSLHESEDSGQTLKASTSGAYQLPTPERVSNGGRPLPDWVKDFNPTFVEYFLREYGHLVEFV